MPASFRRSEEGRVVASAGDAYRFLATGDETDGKYATWEAVVPPGGGPPPHVHSREVESFYVLEANSSSSQTGRASSRGRAISFRFPSASSTRSKTKATRRRG